MRSEIIALSSLTCPEDAALEGALPPIRGLHDHVVDREEDEGEEDDQEEGEVHDDRPHSEPGGDGPVLVAAHRYRPQPPPLKVLVLEKHHLGQTPGGSWEQEVEESLSFRNATIKALFGKHCFLVDLVV